MLSFNPHSMIIIYFAYPVYRFKADGYREPNEKKEEKKKKRENSYFHNKVRIDESRSSGEVLIEKISLLLFRVEGRVERFFETFYLFIVSKKSHLKLLRAKNCPLLHYQSWKRIEGVVSTFSNCKTLTKNDSRNYKGRRDGRLLSNVRAFLLLECSSLEHNLFFVHLYREPLDRSFFFSFFPPSSISKSLSKRALWPPISVDKTA